MSEIERWFEAYSALPSAEDAGRALAAELDAESRGESEQTNGIEIPEEAVEVVAKAMWGGDDWEAAGRCYPWNPDMDDCLQATLNVEVGIRAFLDALGATVERDWINDQGEAIYPGPSPDPTHSRIVTSWRRSPDE